MAFDFTLVLAGLLVFEMSGGASNNVYFVNATRQSDAFQRSVPGCTPDWSHGCACDGTKLYPHSPYLTFDLEDVRGPLPESVEYISGPDGRQYGRIDLTAKYVRVQGSISDLRYPERRNPKDRSPHWLKNDAQAFGATSCEGWIATLNNPVDGCAPRLVHREVGKRVTSRLSIEAGDLKTVKPYKEDGKYVKYNMAGGGGECRPGSGHFPKALSDRVRVTLKKQQDVALRICDEPDCQGSGVQELVFNPEDKSKTAVVASLTNVPDGPPHHSSMDRSSLDHFAWFYELVEWSSCGCPDKLPRPIGPPRLLVSNAFCPNSQWP